MREKKPIHIVVAEPFAPQAIDRLRQIGRVSVLDSSAPEALVAAIRDADALLVRTKAHVTARIIDAAPNLKVIGRASPSIDHIDLRAARRRQIQVVYAPHIGVQATAEFELALILSLTRRIPFIERLLRKGEFDTLRNPSGHAMGQLTLGLFGLDPVAEHLGAMCRAAFGQKVVYCDPLGRHPVQLSAEKADEDALFASSDILALHLPARAETKRIMDERRIMKMKAGSFLVNASRGSLVDTVAVAHGLRCNHLAGAALDVFDSEPLPRDHPIRRAPNCILTPHIAAATLDGAEDRFKVADDVIRVLQGQPPQHPFDAESSARQPRD